MIEPDWTSTIAVGLDSPYAIPAAVFVNETAAEVVAVDCKLRFAAFIVVPLPTVISAEASAMLAAAVTDAMVMLGVRLQL